MVNSTERVMALFYCQNVPGARESDRQALEKRFKGAIRLFPLPCSGRLEPVHLLKALETFADGAYLVTCPEGACRHFEGNLRARKRVERARAKLLSIGLEGERVGLFVQDKEAPRTLAEVADTLMQQLLTMSPSPVRKGERLRT